MRGYESSSTSKAGGCGEKPQVLFNSVISKGEVKRPCKQHSQLTAHFLEPGRTQ